MSRFIAIMGNETAKLKLKAQDILPGTEFLSSDNEKFCLAVSGYGKTTFAGQLCTDGKDFIWAACGQGVGERNDLPFFMNQNDWQNYLFGNDSHQKINGHFACIKATESKADIFNDELGNREFYLFAEKDYAVVSTELILLIQLIENPEFNFEALSTRWLLENQMTSDSPVKQIKRYSQGSRLIIDFEGAEISIQDETHPWTPWHNISTTPAEVTELLTKFTIFIPQDKGRLKLGLSGGLDSRLLLALLSGKTNGKFGLFTFGNREHTDRIISEKIAEKLNLELRTYNDDVYESADEIKGIEKFIAVTQGTAPASEYFMKRNYYDVATGGDVIIDGGFGEILRRGLFNKLKYSGKNFIRDKNPERFIDIIKLNRCPYFSVDFTEFLNNSAVKQVEKMFGSMPDIDDNIDYWLDLLSIRTKMNNYCNFEQARTDEFCISYTPFSQPELLHAIFSLDTKYKNNASLVNKIIEDNSKILTKIELAKGTVTIPFGYPTFVQKGIAKVKNKLNLNWKDALSIRFLNSYKEYIYDRINSADFKSNSIFNNKKLRDDVDSFYKGKYTLAKGIDWWLTIDIFINSGKSS